MKSPWIIAIAVLMLGSVSLSAQTERQLRADSVFRHAVQLIDAGEFDEAWGMLDEAEEQFPEYSLFTFEKGYIRMAQGRYDDAVTIFESILDARDANARYYSMLGNAYDLAGDPERAIETYRKGLEIFPDAGEIFVELGTMMAKQEKWGEAVEYWERGALADPTYPSNHFRAAQMYLPTEIRGWGMLYGEGFILLEFGSERSNEIRQMLFDAYQEAVTLETVPAEESSSGSESMTFSFEFFEDGMSMASTDSGLVAAFPFFFEMNAGIGSLAFIEPQEVTIASLITFRQMFVETWFTRPHIAEAFDIGLFEYHRQMIEADVFEAYNYILFACDDTIDEVRTWAADHQEEIETMAAWITDNPYATTVPMFSRLDLPLLPVDPDNMPGIQMNLEFEKE